MIHGLLSRFCKPAQLALRVSALTCLATSSWADVHIVDSSGGPGADFADIQLAIDAAVAGDTIYIRPGLYAAFVISGKSLTLARQGVGTVRVNGEAVIEDIVSDSGVQLDGLSLFGIATPTKSVVSIENCSGPVWLSDCSMTGRNGSSPMAAGGSGLRSSSSADVGLIRCVFKGGRGADGTRFWLSDGGSAGHGLDLDSSNVQLFECTVTGGNGGDAGSGSSAQAGYSGKGIRAFMNSHVFVSESVVTAGNQGWPSYQCGLPVWTIDSTVREYESSFLPVGCQPPMSVPSADTTSFCFGTPSACPCTNQGSGGNGCANSYGTGGGKLWLSGNASVSNDTITLHHSGIASGKPLLFFQGTFDGTAGLGIPLGDGLLCAGGSILRLATRISNGVESSFGFSVPTDPSLSLSGQVSALGGTRYYQVWYRDPNASCAAGQFNLSNGITIPWRP